MIFEALATFSNQRLMNLDDFQCLINISNLVFYSIEEIKKGEKKQSKLTSLLSFKKSPQSYYLELFLGEVNGFGLKSSND
mmetsp:Transcript_31812/g.31106  ORF Transcript_31812/g.31106 Transcript_31812/m.31106 type:complete len:80 (+) Transcript_31812:314-553(+)